MRRFKLRQRRGATTVEMALCLPILFLVIFALVEFARANQIRQTVKQAAYEAARIAITPDATVSQVTNHANTILNSVGISGYTVTVTPNPLTTATTDVTVTVSASPTANGWLIRYFTGGQSIAATVTMESENIGISFVGAGS